MACPRLQGESKGGCVCNRGVRRYEHRADAAYERKSTGYPQQPEMSMETARGLAVRVSLVAS
eukprot:scaffold69768_cov34-Prasinocladus_malaysianus.AAC.1